MRNFTGGKSSQVTAPARVPFTSQALLGSLPSSAPVDLDTAGRKLRIFFWPHYRSNPYQSLLYGRNGSNYTIEAGDIHQALSCLASSSRAEICVFHLHWLAAVIGVSESPAEAKAKAGEFLRDLSAFAAGGGKFVWTIHNVTSHDTPHAMLEAEISRELSRRADIIHVHGRAAIAAASEVFPIDDTKVVVAEHGNYVGVYANSIDRREARSRLGLSTNALIFLLFGQIRPYKGTSRLLAELSAIARQSDEELGVVIAGKPLGVDPEVLRREVGSHLRAVLHLSRVDDADVQIYMRAADFLVLPFQRILTSGSAILGLSFGTPIIAPCAGLLPELITHGREGILYDAEDPLGFSKSLRLALSLAPEERAKMARLAFSTAQALNWRCSRERVLRAIVGKGRNG